MKKIALIALIASSATYSFGQRTFGVKIYQNTDIFATRYSESGIPGTTKVENLNFGRVSLALNIETAKRVSHEIELLIPEVSKPLDKVQFPMNYEFGKNANFDGNVSSYSVRYELSKAFTDEDQRFTFLPGAGINPYFVNIEYEPNVETSFYHSTTLYGFALNMTPRVKYDVSQRFSIDLNIPLKVYDLRAEHSMVKNPAIPIRQQTNNSESHIFFESAYTVRFGLMYTFGK
jgi:hypothetical protein